MEFADYHGVEPAKTDRVSSFIRALAVGLMVLGMVFGVLDWHHVFDRLESPPAVETPST